MTAGDLEQRLRTAYGNVNHTGSGVWEVVDDDGEVFSIHVSLPQWRRLVERVGDEAFDQLDDVVSARSDDEDHIVLVGDAFQPSVRADLPPVRSRPQT